MYTMKKSNNSISFILNIITWKYVFMNLKHKVYPAVAKLTENKDVFTQPTLVLKNALLTSYKIARRETTEN